MSTVFPKKQVVIGRKKFDSDEDDNDLENMLPPPPKKPVARPLSITNVINNKQIEDSSSLENSATRKRSNDNTLQSVQSIAKKRPTDASVLQDNNNAILLTDIINSIFQIHLFIIMCILQIAQTFQERSLHIYVVSVFIVYRVMYSRGQVY